MKWTTKSAQNVENIAIESNSVKFAFNQSRGDEVFGETKGCGDEMSICAVSILIPPFRATIIGCINCFYYSESDPLLSMTALF